MRVEEDRSEMEARSAPILCCGRLMFPTLMHLPDDGEPDRQPHSPLEPSGAAVPSGDRDGGPCLRTQALTPSATRTVLEEQAGLQHDLSFPCFSGIVKVWDAVSHYIRRQFALNEVGLAISSSLHTLLLPRASTPQNTP